MVNEAPPRAAAGPPGWQARKSAATREQIIAAAIRCLGERGYARLTTTTIAVQAGLSRGALLHHFRTRSDIVQALVAALADGRLAALRAARERPATDVRDRISALLEAYWGELSGASFRALFELVVAARGDRALASLVDRAQAAFEVEWSRTASAVSPADERHRESLELALELARYALEGMAVGALTREPDGSPPRLLRHLAARLCELVAAAPG